MIAKRFIAFLIDISIFVMIILLFENIIASIMFFYSTEYSGYSNDGKSTQTILFLIPFLFSFFESGLVIENTIGKKLMGIKLHFLYKNKFSRSIKTILRSFFFFYFSFYISGIMFNEIFIDGYYFLNLLILFNFLITPVSIIISKGNVGIHDLIFDSHMQNKLLNTRYVNRKIIDYTFCLSLFISLCLYILGIAIFEYREELYSVLKFESKGLMENILTQFEKTRDVKEIIHDKMNLSYSIDLKKEFSINIGSDFDNLYNTGIDIENISYVDRVAFIMNYSKNENNYILREVEILVFLTGSYSYNIEKKIQISDDLFNNIPKILPESLAMFEVKFIRAVRFDMAIVGYSENIVFFKDSINQTFNYLYCYSEPIHLISFNAQLSMPL